MNTEKNCFIPVVSVSLFILNQLITIYENKEISYNG